MGRDKGAGGGGGLDSGLQMGNEVRRQNVKEWATGSGLDREAGGGAEGFKIE